MLQHCEAYYCQNVQHCYVLSLCIIVTHWHWPTYVYVLLKIIYTKINIYIRFITLEVHNRLKKKMKKKVWRVFWLEYHKWGHSLICSNNTRMCKGKCYLLLIHAYQRENNLGTNIEDRYIMYNTWQTQTRLFTSTCPSTVFLTYFPEIFSEHTI